MSESVRDYVTTYSFNKLEETAKTFRRLGEVYENAAEFKTADPGISRQLLLVAYVLDECVPRSSGRVTSTAMVISYAE